MHDVISTHDSVAHPTPKPDPAQIGLKSLSGDFTPGILCLAGLLSGIRVVLLVDGRNPHTFFQIPLSISLRLTCRTAPTLFRMIFLPYGYFVELQVRRNKPWDPGIIFESCSLNAQHLEDKVFLMGQGVIGKQQTTEQRCKQNNQQRCKQDIQGCRSRKSPKGESQD